MSIRTIFPRFSCCLFAGFFIGIVGATCTFGEARKRWVNIPTQLEGVTETYISDFAVGREGIPWVAFSTPHHTVCYWKGGKWHKLNGIFTTGAYLARLFVSPPGKVYLSQPGRESYVSPPPHLKGHFGALYLLENGKTTYITEYYYETAGEYPPLYFDTQGRIWNWGNKFIGKFENGKWKRVEASVGKPQGFWRVLVVEDGDGNLFFIGSKTISCYVDGVFKVNLDLPKVPLRGSAFKARLWGNDKVLFISYGNRGVAVLDLKTLKFQKGLFENTSLFECKLYDLFRDREGNIWVLARNRKKAKNYFYIKVSAKDASLEEIISTSVIKWDNHRNSQCPESVLCAQDRVIYFGPPGNGIYIFRDGKVSHFGWKQGVTLSGVNWVYEGRDGRIWFASCRSGIAVYDPEGVAVGLVSPFVERWVDFELASRAVIKDYTGNIWCFLKDKPGHLSMWDGETWQHFEVGIDTSKASTLLIDNLNRIHIWMIDYPSGVHRLGPNGIVHFKDIKDMLVDSVKTGSREFKSSAPNHILPPLVTKEREIWFCLHNYNYFYHYDGIQWHQFNMADDIYHIFKWKNDSFMLRTQGGKFFAFDRGQLVEFRNEQTINGEYLLGECGYQLFDRGIYETNKERFYPMRRTYKGIYLFKNLKDFLYFSEDKVPKTAIKLSKYLDRIWLTSAGFWSHSDNLPELKRYYQGLMFKVDLSKTPIGTSFWAYHVNVYEDRRGNLWLCRDKSAFMVKRGVIDTEITIPKKVVYETRKLHIAYSGMLDGRKSKELKYSWRLGGGGWSEPSETKDVELYFEESGLYDFQVMAIGEMGNVDRTPATLKLNIVIPLPKVKIVTRFKEVIEELDVTINYEVVRREEGSRLSFQWRVDGGKWNNTYNNMVILSGLEDGRHIFEVRAVEDNKYLQSPPDKVEFILERNYEKIILREINRLKSDEYAQREKAMTILISIGEKCLPYLRRELKKATPDTKWWIKSTIWQIEH